MFNNRLIYSFITTVCLLSVGCARLSSEIVLQDVEGKHRLIQDALWLSHEHILVDFIGANAIEPLSEDERASVVSELKPYLNSLEAYGVRYFVDATPMYIGRDVKLLHLLAQETGLQVITNTGIYGARGNVFVPEYLKKVEPQVLADQWVGEFQNGIDGTDIKPGFIKIGVDSVSPLSPLHQRLVEAAALTHKRTGMVIASHTGEAIGLWPQLEILKAHDVPMDAFIWVHAYMERDNSSLLEAAEEGCWISLDGVAWKLTGHVEKLVFAKENGILDHVLISHDAGWFDPQKQTQSIKPYTNIFTDLIPKLKARGFTEQDIYLLMSTNPAKAFSLR